MKNVRLGSLSFSVFPLILLCLFNCGVIGQKTDLLATELFKSLHTESTEILKPGLAPSSLAFIQACEKNTAAQDDTIQSLLALAAEKVDLSKSPDVCTIAFEELKNRKELNLGMRHIKNLSPLASLTQLEKLYLHHNQIEDLGPLQGLPKLTLLNINGNRVQSLVPLAALSLKQLWAGGNQIKEIPTLLNWEKMEFLNLGKNQIEDVSPLAGLKTIQTLNLDENRIRNIDGLASLSALQKVYLSHNQIMDFNVLAQLPRLEEARINHNPGTCPLSITAKCQPMNM